MSGPGQQSQNRRARRDVRIQAQVQPEGQEGLTEAAGQARPAGPGGGAAGRRGGGAAQFSQGHQGQWALKQ